MCLATRLRAAEPPFGPAKQSSLWCWSRVTGMFGSGPWDRPRPRSIRASRCTGSFPMLIAAIDPAAEAKLDGLNRAVTSGRYLR